MEKAGSRESGFGWRILLTLDLDQIPGAGHQRKGMSAFREAG
jgi:hypothetical protein